MSRVTIVPSFKSFILMRSFHFLVLTWYGTHQTPPTYLNKMRGSYVKVVLVARDKLIAVSAPPYYTVGADN